MATEEQREILKEAHRKNWDEQRAEWLNRHEFDKKACKCVIQQLDGYKGLVKNQQYEIGTAFVTKNLKNMYLRRNNDATERSISSVAYILLELLFDFFRFFPCAPGRGAIKHTSKTKESDEKRKKSKLQH